MKKLISISKRIILGLFLRDKRRPLQKRKRKSTKKYALVMPYGKYKNRLLGDVPPRHAQKLLKDGKLDRPGYKWLKSGLKKHGKLEVA